MEPVSFSQLTAPVVGCQIMRTSTTTIFPAAHSLYTRLLHFHPDWEVRRGKIHGKLTLALGGYSLKGRQARTAKEHSFGYGVGRLAWELQWRGYNGAEKRNWRFPALSAPAAGAFDPVFGLSSCRASIFRIFF